MRTQLDADLARLSRPLQSPGKASADDTLGASVPSSPSRHTPPRLAAAGPAPQAAIQPGAWPQAEQSVMLCNGVGRVVSKAFDEGCMVTVHFHNIAKHRKKMAPIRAPHAFHAAALSDAGAGRHLHCPCACVCSFAIRRSCRPWLKPVNMYMQKPLIWYRLSLGFN